MHLVTRTTILKEAHTLISKRTMMSHLTDTKGENMIEIQGVQNIHEISYFYCINVSTINNISTNILNQYVCLFKYMHHPADITMERNIFCFVCSETDIDFF